MDGVKTLSKELIQDCGYGRIDAPVEDVVVCYNDIILVHHKVSKLWYNSYVHTMGPQVDKILRKSRGYSQNWTRWVWRTWSTSTTVSRRLA
jgi:hypothetical protein